MNKPHPAPARKVEHGTFTRCPVCLQAVVLRDQQTNHDVVVNLKQYDAMQEALEDAVRRIQNEYCSHPEPCSATLTTCYAQKQLAALAAHKEAPHA